MPWGELTEDEKTDAITVIVRLNGGPRRPKLWAQANALVRSNYNSHAITRAVIREWNALELEPWGRDLYSASERIAGRKYEETEARRKAYKPYIIHPYNDALHLANVTPILLG